MFYIQSLLIKYKLISKVFKNLFPQPGPVFISEIVEKDRKHGNEESTESSNP